MTAGTLILVTGPAAVGKSTITKALQSELGRNGELWLAIEVDIFARALSSDWVVWGKHQGRYAKRGFIYARADDGSIELTLGADGRRVLAAFHRSVAAVVSSGINVICETIVYDDEDWNDWSRALGDIPARWVKLSAPVDVLDSREKALRLPVAHGLGRGMSARRVFGSYDIEADTAAETPSGIVARIIATLPA